LLGACRIDYLVIRARRPHPWCMTKDAFTWTSTHGANLLPAPSSSPPSTARQQSGHWGGVFAMTVCVFALVASEFMPVSLLTPVASALSVSEGLAGQGIAISGAFAVLTSLSISRLSGRVDRRTLLLSLAALMGCSGAGVG